MPDRKREHVEYQKAYFDKNYDFFRQSIPADVVDRTKEIVRTALLDSNSRVLDVGTGMGVLIPHFAAQGVKPENIVGCDLSEQMLAEARARNPGVRFWQGDFAELPAEFGNFDAVFFNACFGNFFDETATLQNAASRLCPGGRIVISHPMGNPFVKQLKAQDPQLVLNPLPSKDELEKWCAALGLELAVFCDEPNLYIAILRQVTAGRL